MNYRVRIFIISVFLSVLLWFVNHLNHEFTVKVPFTIHYSGFSPDASTQLNADTTIEAEITSKGFSLISYYFKHQYLINLSKADFTPVVRGDSVQYILHPEDLMNIIAQSLPQGFIVAKAPEDTLMFSFVSYPTKEVPIKVPLSITCADGYMISGPVRISPRMVILNGPIEILNGIDSAITNTIESNDISDTLSTETNIQAFSDKRIRSSLKKVRIIIPVEKSKLLVVKKSYNMEHKNHKYNGEVEIVLTVPESINNVNVVLRSDVGDENISFRVQVPDFIKVNSISPETIPLSIQ